MSHRKAIVLAAGQGTRMKSDLPKVLFPVCGRPMIHYVLDALEQAGIDDITVVVGYCAEQVQQELRHRKNLSFVTQQQRLGTGHAVMSARARLESFQGPVFVIAGDSPMIRSDSVAALFTEYEKRTVQKNAPILAGILGTAFKDNPQGMGRILRDEHGHFVGIVEEKDASPEQRLIREINMSYYIFDSQNLLLSLDGLRADNAQKEYYITDVPLLMMRRNLQVLALPLLQPEESLGVNTIEDLAAVEREMKSHGK